MNITDQIYINTGPEFIWPFLADPEKMKRWNPKIVKVSGHHHGELSTGDRYLITYQMNQRDTDAQAEIIQADKPRHLHIRMVNHMPTEQPFMADETYELSYREGRTLVQQRLVIGLKVNVFLRCLIFLLVKFGKPPGETYLQTLKKLAEEEQNRSAA